ncbi:MAG: hypothetical protein [Bacteriophage sp.]|nr:MAG: hypothetical protein [Bacteriophage sp.]
MLGVIFELSTRNIQHTQTLTAVEYLTFQRFHSTAQLGTAFLTDDNVHTGTLSDVMNNPSAYVINELGNAVLK